MPHPPTRENISDRWLIVLLGCLSAISPFTIDLYLPAFPEIATDLQTPAARVALSVSTYFLGYAAGQILYGPLLDRFGRKRPLYFGLLLYILSTIGCALTSSIDVFLILRFIQALGGSVSSVASMAMVRDFFPPEKGARILSLMMLVLGTSPLFAPTIGGWILLFAGWRTIFYTLAAGVAILLLVIHFFLPEGHEPDPTVSLAPGPILRDFAEIHRHPLFRLYAWAGALAFSGLFVYVASSPAMFMGKFQVSAQIYGLIFGVLGSGMILGSQFNHLLAKHLSSIQIFGLIMQIRVVLAAVFLAGAWMGWAGLYTTIACLYFLMMSSGIAYPNAVATALGPFSRNAGRASALTGFINLGMGSALSAAVGLVEIQSTMPTAATIFFSSLAAWVLLKTTNARSS